MKVSDILHEKGSNVLTVVRSDSVSKAVDILGEHNVGVVVVLGDVEKCAAFFQSVTLCVVCANQGRQRLRDQLANA